MNRETLRQAWVVPAFVFALAAATIAGAWAFQLAFGFVPCKLCLEQRIPYYVGVPLAFASLVAALMGARRASGLLLLLAGLAFVVNAYLGLYHAGVEWKWWEGPADCGVGGAAPVTSTADLLNQLKGIRIVSCTEAAWRFLGLSFAGWNMVISLVLTAAAAFGAGRGLVIVRPATAAERTLSAADRSAG
jgi:disulfide bond formation protein DsbB